MGARRPLPPALSPHPLLLLPCVLRTPVVSLGSGPRSPLSPPRWVPSFSPVTATNPDTFLGPWPTRFILRDFSLNSSFLIRVFISYQPFPFEFTKFYWITDGFEIFRFHH